MSHKMSCTFFPCSMSLIILRVSLPIYEHVLAPSQSKRMWKGAWRAWHTWRTKCLVGLVSKSEITAARRIATAFTKQTFKPSGTSVYFAKWPKLERKVLGNHCRFAYEHLGQRNGRYLVLEFKIRVFFSCVSLFHAFSHCLCEYCWHIHAIDT